MDEILNFEFDEKKIQKYNSIMRNIKEEMKSNSLISFYGYILDNISFKYVKYDKKRKDFDIGIEILDNNIFLALNPILIFSRPKIEMMFRIIHELEHILREDVLVDLTRYPDIIETMHFFRTENRLTDFYRKQTPLAYVAMDLSINSLKYINKHSNGYEIGSDYLLKDGIFPLEYIFTECPPYKSWQWYYKYIIQLANKNEGFYIQIIDNGVKLINVDIYSVNITDTTLNNTWRIDVENPIQEESLRLKIREIIKDAGKRSFIPTHYKTGKLK